MLTYEYQEIFKVKQDGKLLGEIRSEVGGYRYWPKGVKNVFLASTLFSTTSELKRLLEG